MENVQSKAKTHPLIIAAAGSVILFSVLGSAAIMGWIPKGGAQPGAGIAEFSGAGKDTIAVTAASAPEAQTVNAAPAPSPAARVVARPAPRPVARTEPRPAHDTHPTPVESRSTPAPEVRHAEDQRTILAQAQEAPPAPVREVAPVCHECGIVQSVNEIEKPGEGSGLGAVAGGVVGAIAGKQVGGGRGRNVMSVLGAVGGAFAGNAIEKNVKKVKSYDITIRFEDGSTRTLSQATQPVWRSGDRVRLINGAIQPNA